MNTMLLKNVDWRIVELFHCKRVGRDFPFLRRSVNEISLSSLFIGLSLSFEIQFCKKIYHTVQTMFIFIPRYNISFSPNILFADDSSLPLIFGWVGLTWRLASFSFAATFENLNSYKRPSMIRRCGFWATDWLQIPIPRNKSICK